MHRLVQRLGHLGRSVAALHHGVERNHGAAEHQGRAQPFTRNIAYRDPELAPLAGFRVGASAGK